MNNRQNTSPIGVFDSGIGGISVLGQMLKTLPDEQYVYMADSANAPYGTKSCDFVRDVSVNAARTLYNRGIKALVVACNTATSVAINNIRAELNIPVIGMEPALKLAAEREHTGHIVVMATPLTLNEEKFNNLYRKYNADDSVVPLPCPGLVELIESEEEPAAVADYLEKLFMAAPAREISTVVLGCTHYCFIKKEIYSVLGPKVCIVDGNEGTVRHLKGTLQSAGLLADPGQRGTASRVEFLTSGDKNVMIPLCQRFLTRTISE